MTLIAISSYSTHLESKTILPLTFISNLTTSTEYTLRKLNYLSSKETMTFHLDTLSSRYHIKSTKGLLLSSHCSGPVDIHQYITDPDFFTICITMSHMTNFSHTYTMVKMIKTLPNIIRVTISKSIQ